jgi:hypothetical protein
MAMSGRILYRWSDDSSVGLLSGRDDSEDTYLLYAEKQIDMALLLRAKIMPSGPQVSINGSSLGEQIRDSGVPLKSVMLAYPLVKSRLFGFLIDAGVRAVRDGHLLQSRVDYDLRMPAFVSNEQWENRYQIARDFYVSDRFHLRETPRYLSRVRNLQLCSPQQDPLWKVRWSDRASKRAPLPGVSVNTVFAANSLEEAIDLVTEQNLVLPESKKGEWDRENVEHGVFVLPTPEEVEVFRILDEPLPFFLPWKQAEEWLRGQS